MGQVNGRGKDIHAVLTAPRRGAWVIVGENGPFSRISMTLATFLEETLWLTARRSGPSVGRDPINFI